MRSILSNHSCPLADNIGRWFINISYCLLFFLFSSFPSIGQTDSTGTVLYPYITREDSVVIVPDTPRDINREKTYSLLTPAQKKKRTWLVAGANVIGYGSTMIALYSSWYNKYPQTGFHTFNDWHEWKQVDKVGHVYSAYIESFGSMEMWRWTGMERKKRIWIGGMSGAAYQTVIEVLDGFSAGWGWSWPDFGANILGSAVLISQELAWNEQRIRLKFSFHGKHYNDPVLEQRSKELFGAHASQSFIKDYNGQTYWASVNLSSFFPRSKLASWLAVSIGYGAEGLFGGTQNYAEDKNGNIIFNRRDIKRYRQWYLSPDIDLSKIKSNKKVLRTILGALNVFKFPAPALEFSNGKFRAHAIYF